MIAGDLQTYLALQRPSFEHFYGDLGTTWIVTRPRDLPTIASATSGLADVRVVDEQTLVPELEAVRRVRRRTGRDWHFQQLIKLAGVASVDRPFVLVVDADVIAVQPVTDRDLVRDGRALRPQLPLEEHPEWVRLGGVALGLEPLDYAAAVTPSVLAPPAVRELAQFAVAAVRPRRLDLRLASRVPGLRRTLTSWRGRLIGAMPWTEYQIYDTFLVRTGRFDTYHYYSDDPVIYGNSVWTPQDFEGWYPCRPGNEPRHFFSVVQGYLGIPLDEVASRMRADGIPAGAR
jgi:hypothetical protein